MSIENYLPAQREVNVTLDLPFTELELDVAVISQVAKRKAN
jgi:hypothetical protein